MHICTKKIFRLMIDMITSEVQHQFWITKKTVQRKLGSKEDEYIVSSDAGLDAKIALLKSISETSLNLIKILKQYQEKLCILSQEECAFGRFLKEIGKISKTTGLSITNSGKAIYFAGQQRISVRASIERLHHEVDVFRCRAISDTFSTVNNMEKERTEYRAALCWMKSLSTQLDPDNGKGLDKFRRAQAHVRIGKDNFDKLSMDCIQKIDLLTAARCNMFSHCLVAYVSAISQFSKISESAFKVVANALTIKPQNDFYVLKDLSEDAAAIERQAADSDQSMFFSCEFKDTQSGSPLKTKETQKENILAEEIKSSDKMECNWFDTTEIEDYVTGLRVNNNLENLFNIGEGQTFEGEKLLKADKKNTSLKTPEMKEKDEMSWLNFFSELDPFENPQSFDSKLYSKVNTQQT